MNGVEKSSALKGAEYRKLYGNRTELDGKSVAASSITASPVFCLRNFWISREHHDLKCCINRE